MVIAIEGLDGRLNTDLARWLANKLKLEGYKKRVRVVSAPPQKTSSEPDIVFYLDVRRSGLVQRLRRTRAHYLAKVQAHPARYVVIDTALPLTDLRETAWLATCSKLQRGTEQWLNGDAERPTSSLPWMQSFAG